MIMRRSGCRIVTRRLWSYQQRQCMSSTPLSPYKVLQISSSANADQIKAAFRKLAKLYHPDLNPTAEDKMSEIVAAYETLMSDDFGGKDSRVAMACEVFTLEELRLDRRFSVYALQVNFLGEVEGPSDEVSDSRNSALSTDPIYQITIHPQDSVSDFKQCIQETHGSDWGLQGRQQDRYGLALGWEVVITKQETEIMGDHFFLEIYGITHGDIVYAVLTKDSV